MVLTTLKQNIQQLVNGITIKYSKKALAADTTESARAFDEYLSAYYKTDNFYTHLTYPYSVLSNCPSIIGYCESRALKNSTTVATELTTLARNPSLIPTNLTPSDSKFKTIQDEVLYKYRNYVLSTYEETNPYYRTLVGLPQVGNNNETLFVDTSILAENAIDYSKYTNYTISGRVVLHKLTDDDLYILETSGYIDDLKQKYPNLKYLNYLGFHKVDLVIARQARNFSILKIDKEGIPETVYSTFARIYEQCREYFMTVIYNRNMASMYDQYDDFMGLCIMVMTIQRFISNTFKFGVQRDLFDWEFIQNIYKAYNVPFIETLSIDHHIVLLKNLNNLLRHKSTDHVLFEICSLLGLSYVDIYKYYLVKDQLRDDEGKPIFIFKDKYDSDGNVIGKEIDYKQTYQLYFQAVDIEEDNIILALQDSSGGRRVDYSDMVSSDPYWWEDSELEELKYSEVFNYIETKYLSVNLMYKMTEMLFELSYAFRLILDKKESVANYTLSIPKIIPDINFNIFDVVVFMIALLCKKHKFSGNIITDPGLVAHIYGFDFTAADTDEYKSLLESLDGTDPDSVELKRYLTNMNISGDADVSELFTTLRNYNTFMVNKMREIQDIHKYRVYRRIFDITMTEDNMKELFGYTDADSNFVIDKSYEDYLHRAAPLLGGIVSSVADDDIQEYIEHTLSQLDVYVESLQYTHIVSGTDSPLLKALVSLLQFFKSYTVDISKFNIVYLFDSKRYNLIKMIEYINAIHVDMQLPDDSDFHYSDNIHLVSEQEFLSMLKTSDICTNIKSLVTNKDYVSRFIEIMNSLRVEETVDDVLNIVFSDNSHINKSMFKNDGINYNEKLFIISE